ncbi:unnamed protein product [Penicillium bialowiezense]
MKLHGAVILSTFFSLLLAAPTTQTPKTIHAATPLSARSQVHDCVNSTSEDQASNGSPLAADCLKIASNIAGGGSWTILSGHQHQLVQYGTYVMHIGNQDIINLINESVEKFQWYDKVGTKGSMMCKVNMNGRQYVEWGLYHTKK